MIVLQNESAVVADKPHGWLSVPGRDAADPRPVLGRRLEQELGLRLYPVHRLDFEVGGLVLFAKTPEAHRVMQSWFETGGIQKHYHALSKNLPAGVGDEWTQWRSKLVRGKRRAFEASHGKDALTRVRLLSEALPFACSELMPLTGRSHQLRFEMAKHKAPILGDTLYGGEPWDKEASIALRAVRLDLSGIVERLGLPTEISTASFPGNVTKR